MVDFNEVCYYCLCFQKGFMDEILSSGLLLFLSPAWLSEVYQQITSASILESAGFDPTKYSPLVNMLKGKRERNILFNDTLNTYIYGYMAYMERKPAAAT